MKAIGMTLQEKKIHEQIETKASIKVVFGNLFFKKERILAPIATKL